MNPLKCSVPYSDLSKSPCRSKRVAESLRSDLSAILHRHVHDTRLKSVQIMDVVLSQDLRHATVLVYAYREVDLGIMMSALEKASGHIRHLLSKMHYGRYTPRLRFVYDRGHDKASCISTLIHTIEESSHVH